MICMFSRIPERWRGHDVGGRINPHATRRHRVDNVSDFSEFYAAPDHRTDNSLERFPCFNAIKDFEQQSPEEDFLRGLRPPGPILDFPNQILAYTVGGSIRISEPVIL